MVESLRTTTTATAIAAAATTTITTTTTTTPTTTTTTLPILLLLLKEGSQKPITHTTASVTDSITEGRPKYVCQFNNFVARVTSFSATFATAVGTSGTVRSIKEA